MALLLMTQIDIQLGEYGSRLLAWRLISNGLLLIDIEALTYDHVAVYHHIEGLVDSLVFQKPD